MHDNVDEYSECGNKDLRSHRPLNEESELSSLGDRARE